LTASLGTQELTEAGRKPKNRKPKNQGFTNQRANGRREHDEATQVAGSPDGYRPDAD
jgi:hypothetical protein